MYLAVALAGWVDWPRVALGPTRHRRKDSKWRVTKEATNQCTSLRMDNGEWRINEVDIEIGRGGTGRRGER